MVANMATMFTIFVNVYTDSRNRIYRGKAYIFETQKIGIYTLNVFNYAYVVGTKMYRLNETILLCTIKYKPMVAKGLSCLQFFTRIPEIECYQCKAYIFETQKRNQYIHFKCFQPIYILRVLKSAVSMRRFF